MTGGGADRSPDTQHNMTSQYQKRTRTIYQDQINNSRSIHADETLVPVLVKSIKADKTKTGNNPGTAYYRLKVVCMNKEPVFVRYKTKGKKKGELDETEESKRQRIAEEAEYDAQEAENPKGTTVNGGDEFPVTTYDKSAGAVDGGTMVNLALTTSWYNDHYTFSAGSVIIDNKMANALSNTVYNELVVGTKMAEIPTPDNMSEDDFPGETDEKYMARSFIVPLSAYNSTFANVEIQIDESETQRFFCKAKDSDAQLVGVNMPVGDKTSNMIKVVYSPKDDDAPKIMMSLAYMPEVWSCFGVTDINAWQKVGYRLIFNAREWYAYGYTQLTRLNAIIANKSDDDGDDGFQYSTGFVSKMAVNLKDTIIVGCGVPLSFEYINDNFGEDSKYDREIEVENHPINSNFRGNLKRNRPFITNLTELSTEQVHGFIKDYVKGLKDRGDAFKVKFYGVFASDDVYEFAADNDAAREAFIVEKNHVPSMVFAINI